MAAKNKKGITPLPGFPWNGKFQDMAAIREYFSHDRLQCLLCGRDYVGLGNHIIEGHDMPLDDYRARFGLPWSFGLAGKSLKASQSRRIKQTRREGRMPVAPPPEHVRSLQEHKRRKNRKAVQAVRHELGRRVLHRFGLERKWEAADFEEYLRRIKTGRTPQEVGKDKDMPAAYLFHKHLGNTPDFRKKFEKAWDGLPYAVQSRGLHFGETLKNRVVALRMKGRSWPEVGDLMGLPENTVRSVWFKMKHEGSPAVRRRLEEHEKSLKRDPAVFNEYLNRIAAGRTPSEVGRDKDMPSRLAFDKHVRENPAYRKKYEKIWEALPFAVQARGQKTGARFEKAVLDLRLSGMTWKGLARKLGVRQSTVLAAWNKMKRRGLASQKKAIAVFEEKMREAKSWPGDQMEEYLRRIKSGRTPTEVAGDKDMPRRAFFEKYVKKHPDFAARYRKIWDSLPFSVQLRGNRLGDRFKKKLVRLKKAGLDEKRIADKLGVRVSVVRSCWYRLRRSGNLNRFM